MPASRSPINSKARNSIFVTIGLVTAMSEAPALAAQVAGAPFPLEPRTFGRASAAIHLETGWSDHTVGGVIPATARLVWNPGTVGVVARFGGLAATEENVDNGFVLGAGVAVEVVRKPGLIWKPSHRLHVGIGYSQAVQSGVGTWRQLDVPAAWSCGWEFGAKGWRGKLWTAAPQFLLRVTRDPRGAPHTELRPGVGLSLGLQVARFEGFAHGLGFQLFLGVHLIDDLRASDNDTEFGFGIGGHWEFQ